MKAKRSKIILKRCQTQRSYGQSFVELCGILFILIPIAGICLDGFTVALAWHRLEKADNDAARAASMSAPSAIQRGEPRRVVSAVLNSYAKNCSLTDFVSSYSVDESIQSPLPEPPFGGPVNGSVSVIVRSNLSLPFLSNYLSVPALPLVARRTYNYTWTLAPSAAQNLTLDGTLSMNQH